MCGIGAFHSIDGELDTSKCARVLLRLLEVRGRDASGVAWHEERGSQVETMIFKGDIPGGRLASEIKPKSVGSTGIVHTRWATKGDPKMNVNNHPIDVSGIVGVHNGHVSNDDSLLRRIDGYQRVGQVDSEAAFAWLAHGDQSMTLAEKMSMIEGNAALLWLESHDKRQRLHAARLTSSPLVMGQMKRGSVVIASTDAILMEAAKRMDIAFEFVHSFVEGEYAIIESGRICDLITVDMPKRFSLSNPKYGSSSIFEVK